jgi:hypothetical protein
MEKEEFIKVESTGDIWKPTEKGEEKVGLVEDIIEGKFGKQFILLVGDVAIKTPSHKVLQNRLADVKRGQTVKIVFLGTELPTVKGNNPTAMYDVFIRK